MFTGTFSEWPFPKLLDTLLDKRETGLLEIWSSEDSGYFYIKDGEIKDGEVGSSTGAAAVKVARTFVDASFKFRHLEPTDFAQAVWQKKFGSNVIATKSAFLGRETLSAFLAHVVTYSDAAVVIVPRVVLHLVRQALPQLLLYTKSAYRNSVKVATWLQRGTKAVARYVEVSRTVAYSWKLGQLLRDQSANWQVAVRSHKQRILNRANDLNPKIYSSSIRQKATLRWVALSNNALQLFNSNGRAAVRNFRESGVLLARSGAFLTKHTAAGYFEISRKAQATRKLRQGSGEAQADLQIPRRSHALRSLQRACALDTQKSNALVRRMAAPIVTLRVLASNTVVRRLRSNAADASRNIQGIGVSLARRIEVRAALEFFTTVQIRRNVLQPFLRGLADVLGVVRVVRETIFNAARALNYRSLVFVRKRASTLPTLQQVVQSNVSFGLVVVMSCFAIAVCVSKLINSNPFTVDTSDSNIQKISVQSQAKPSKSSKKNRKRHGQRSALQKNNQKAKILKVE